MIAEPCPRDTAPCVGLAAGHRRQDRPGGHDDRHAGRSRDRARRCISGDGTAAVSVIDDDPSALITFGIKPTHPETGYGYIERGPLLETRDGIAGASRRSVSRKARP